jgi:hypothetical protein
MNTDSHSLQQIRSAILRDTIKFLIACKTRATQKQLATIIARIQEKESELFKSTGARLSPEIWQFLFERLAKANAPLTPTSAPPSSSTSP